MFTKSLNVNLTMYNFLKLNIIFNFGNTLVDPCCMCLMESHLRTYKCHSGRSPRRNKCHSDSKIKSRQ